MAVASLKYDYSGDVLETKGGMYIYDGTPGRFYEWQFRTRIRWEATEHEDKQKTMSKIVDSLRGEAALIAMDVGMEDLMKVDGLDKLIAAILKHVFPQARAEAKELYKIGHKLGGIMSRQSGESMMSYVSRRRRWWKMLKSMDNSIELSTTIRGDLMLEASGLSADQQLMVLTSINNEREFDRLATALMEQHPKIHLSDRRQRDDRPSGGYKGGKRGSKGGFRRYANFGAEEDEEDEDYEEEDEPEADDEEEAENETVEDV